MKRGPFWKFRTILSLRDSFHKLREESQTSLQRPEKWSLGLRSPNSISSWVLIARKGHGWDVVILVSIFLSWLCCCCHWHLLLAERFGFQTSNQRLLISPGRAAFGLPLNSSLTPGCLFKGVDGRAAWGYSFGFTNHLHNCLSDSYTTPLLLPMCLRYIADPAIWLSHCLCKLSMNKTKLIRGSHKAFIIPISLLLSSLSLSAIFIL